MYKKFVILGNGMALFIMLTLSNILLVIFNNLFGYYMLILWSSFLAGIIIGDIKKSMIIILITHTLSFIISIFLTISPSILWGPTEDINILLAGITAVLSKHIIISFPASTLLGLLGSFIGKGLQ